MALADVDPDRTGEVRLVTEWSEKDLATRVPGARAVPRDDSVGPGWQVWRAPLTWATCCALRGVFRDRLTVGEALAEWSWDEHRDRVSQALGLRELTAWPREWARGGGPESDDRLYPFQRVGAHFLSRAGDALLGDDMGLGKTVQVQAALEYLCADDFPVLVVCPNSVKRHWARLAERWLTDATPYVVTGSATKRRKVLDAARGDPRALVLVNYEAARLLSRLAPYGSIALKRCAGCDRRYGDETLSPARCEVHRKELNGFGFRTVIYDEVHHLGDPKSKQTRACWAVGQDPSVRRRWGMTGTLFDRPEALWSLLHTVSPREFPSRTAFLERYMLWSWGTFGGQQVVGFNPDTRGELFKIIDSRFRRMPQALVLPQLPPLRRSVRRAVLTPAQRRMYTELEASLVTRTESGELWVVPSAIAVRTRLLQLASATCEVTEKPDPDDPATWVVRLREPAPKLDVLEEVVDELGSATFCVAAPHRQLVELALERLQGRGIRCGVITGGVSEDERHRVLDDLREGRIQCLLFVMKAGGEGLDMAAAGTLVRIQRSYSLLENRQTEKRVHRIGSERHASVHVIDVVAEDTLEETQVEVLNAKLAQLEEVNRDRASLLAGGYHEDSPEIRALDAVAGRVTAADDLWTVMTKEREVVGS